MSAFGDLVVSGGFTTTFESPEVYRHVARTAEAAQPTTLTVRYRARWWKRPWLWLRRRPRGWELTYNDVVFTHLRVTDRTLTAELEALA